MQEREGKERQVGSSLERPPWNPQSTEGKKALPPFVLMATQSLAHAPPLPPAVIQIHHKKHLLKKKERNGEMAEQQEPSWAQGETSKADAVT